MDRTSALTSDVAARHFGNVANAEEYVQRQNLELTRFTVAGFFLIIGSVAIWVAFNVYNVYRNYKDLIETIDRAPVSTVTGKISGLWLALTIQYPFLNSAFGYSRNTAFASAAWILFYSKDFRARLLQLVPFGGSFDQAYAAALSLALATAATNPTASAKYIACTASKATADGKNAQDCYPECQLSTSFGQTDGTIGGLQGAMSLGGGAAGIALMGGTLGPVGLLAVGLAAVAGGIFGAMAANKRKQDAIKQCEANDQNCYKPPGFPPCSAQV